MYYKGTEIEWNGISIGELNYKLTSAAVYYYSKTQPTDMDGNYWHYVDGKIVVW